MLRKSLAILACFLVFYGSAPRAQTPASSTGTIAGVILNPSGQPAFGFRVVLVDVASNTKYTSEPTDAAGNYSVGVPIGGRYKIDGVIADDGVTHLPVLEVPPVSVLQAGTTRMNVRFTTGSAGAAPATAAAASTEQDKNKKKGAVPWYKTPGGITGIVVGSAVIVGLLLSGGGGSSSSGSVSPSTPE